MRFHTYPGHQDPMFTADPLERSNVSKVRLIVSWWLTGQDGERQHPGVLGPGLRYGATLEAEGGGSDQHPRAPAAIAPGYTAPQGAVSGCRASGVDN